MRVRIKEFIWHIVIMFIVFLYMLTINLIYTNYVNDTLNDSSRLDAKSLATSEVANLNNAITNVLSNYNNKTKDYQTVTRSDKETNESGYFLEVNSGSLYCYIKVKDNTFIKTSMSETFYNYKHNDLGSIYNEGLNYGLLDVDGTVYWSFKDGLSSSTSLISLVGDSETSTSVLNEAKTNKGSFAFNANYNSKDCYIALSYLSDDIYFYEFYDVALFEERLSTSSTISAVYRVGLLIGFSVLLADLISIILRSNRVLKIRRNTAAKQGTAIIKINKRGKVKFYARGRDTYGREVYNLAKVFRPVSGNSFEDELKYKTRFVCEYTNDDTIEYAEFISINQRGGYTIVSNVITDEYKKETELKKITEQNPITGLPNRGSLVKDFDELKKNFLNKDVCIARIKLIEFDFISKTLGFKAGDLLVNSSVDIIKNNVGENYFLYQMENDTLLLILYGNRANNDKIIYSLFESFNHPISIGKTRTFVHLKIGVVEIDNAINKDFKIQEALEKSILALTHAIKQVSVDVVKYDKNLENYLLYRKQMEEDMHNAIVNGEFVMFYQPQYNIREKRITGFESLLRWNSDKYRTVSPQEYIELAEQNGDIVEIGKFINSSVFKAAKEFQNYNVHLSINVSPAQLVQSGFVDELLEEFKKNDLKRGSICIEITETFVMQNMNTMVQKLNILRDNGFKIHLDDFGSGYSSMMYLKEIPVDTIKTDMSFIRNLETDKTSQAIESTIIDLVKKLNLHIICEGVERKTQAKMLDEYGADTFQGYLISKPINYDDALDLVKNGITLDYEGGK